MYTLLLYMLKLNGCSTLESTEAIKNWQFPRLKQKTQNPNWWWHNRGETVSWDSKTKPAFNFACLRQREGGELVGGRGRGLETVFVSSRTMNDNASDSAWGAWQSTFHVCECVCMCVCMCVYACRQKLLWSHYVTDYRTLSCPG